MYLFTWFGSLIGSNFIEHKMITPP
eukprot:COSAG01_NODE_62856_length_282_cov_1.409836_2_plen_24_part_01